MAITIADYAKQEQTALQKFILQNLLRYSDLMSLVPTKKVDSLTTVVTRWKNLPSVGHRQINGSYTESTGQTEQITEGVYAIGGEIKYDRVFKLVKNHIEDPAKTQAEMKIRSLAYTFNDELINGDHASDVNAPEGLNKRIASYLPARQSISVTAALDVTASAANMHTFIDKLHELVELAGLRNAPLIIPKKGDKQPAKSGALLMNRGTYLGVGRVLRRLGLLETTQDAYGREFKSFDGVPFVDVGLKSDQSTEIILDTYGAGGNQTRIFAVRFGGIDGFEVIQLNTPEPYNPVKAGEGAGNTTGPQMLDRIDWWMGFCGYGSYYAARLTGVLAPGSWT
jgi:hypothetical protein